MTRLLQRLGPAILGILAMSHAVMADPKSPAGQAKPLYYRNPMGLPDKSPVPKKDGMGMDYVPVFADDMADPSSVKISPEKVQKLGVRTEIVALRDMNRNIRAVGTLAPDDRRVSVMTAKFDGWVEKINFGVIGDTVRRGQGLLEVYSPDLILAQQEYLIARRAEAEQNAQGPIAQAALKRLKNFDISGGQVDHLNKLGQPSRTLTLSAPRSGLVIEKIALEGMRFQAGDILFRIADLSVLWVIADVFEQDLGDIDIGQTVSINVQVVPSKTYAGTIERIYPSLNKETRTAKVRIALANPDLKLRPDMYATVNISGGRDLGQAVAVSVSAVLDNGSTKIVLVDLGDGKFQPRQVKLGRKFQEFYWVETGLAVGEKVVVGANFLIDAESNLRAALNGFTAQGPQGAHP